MAAAKRKNRSRKKTKSIAHTHVLRFKSRLMHSFIGKPETLPNMTKNHKVRVRFELSENYEDVIFYITGKHRNQIEIVENKFIDRYNKIVKITNNIITSIQSI